MSMMRYDPFREALSLRRAMDQLFEQSFVNPSAIKGTQMAQLASAPMNIYEDDQGYHVSVALPGVNPQDVDVTIHNNTLTIKGQYSSSTPGGQSQGQGQNQGTSQSQGTSTSQGTSQTQGTSQGQGTSQSQGTDQSQNQGQQGNWLVQEMNTGSFERSVTFARPVDVDKVQTNFQNGVLNITLPISEASRPRRISVGSSQSQQGSATSGQQTSSQSGSQSSSQSGQQSSSQSGS